MSLTVRHLGPDDAEAARKLSWEAFGGPATPPTEPASLDRPGMTFFGAFDSERLSGQLIGRQYDSWFGGRLQPTCGVAGVTVVAEDRGQGGLTPLFRATLDHAQSYGAVISTLFPTAPRIYRRFGYEVVCDYATVAVPSWVLASVVRPPEVTTRRAVAADVPAVRAVYDAWAAQQNGPLSRRGVSFPATAEEYLAGFTGVTVARDAVGTIIGFASWHRGRGYGAEAVLEVGDLLATTPDGYRALLAAMGSFASVTPTTTIDTSGDDVARLFLATSHWQVTRTHPYMLKVIDVLGALAGRRYPAGVDVRLGFRLRGDFVADNDGDYELETVDGWATCSRSRTSEAERTFTPQGLALMYAGTQSSANLRLAGHLVGGDVGRDAVWDALFGGRQMHIRDYF